MRAMAFLAGLPYKSKQNMTHWLQYLPTTYSAKYGGNCPTEFKAMCSLCVTDNHWQFPHRCLAQRYIIPEIINETRSALERYAKVHNKIIFEFFKGTKLTRVYYFTIKTTS